MTNKMSVRVGVKIRLWIKTCTRHTENTELLPYFSAYSEGIILVREVFKEVLKVDVYFIFIHFTTKHKYIPTIKN